MLYDYPEDADTTLMEIPKEYGSGSYVIQYWWSGYYDCVDVNVLPVPSTDIWGSGGGQAGYNRIDHCQFIDGYDNFAMAGTCIGIDADEDITACNNVCNAAAGCDAIQVVQTKLDKRVTDAGVWAGTDHVPASCPKTKAFVCYGVKQGTPKVGPTYSISSDPEDPVFYHSCFKKSTGWRFNQRCEECPQTTIEPGWVFGRDCISCNEMRINAANPSVIPKWDFVSSPDQCRHCDNQG